MQTVKPTHLRVYFKTKQAVKSLDFHAFYLISTSINEKNGSKLDSLSSAEAVCRKLFLLRELHAAAGNHVPFGK